MRGFSILAVVMIGLVGAGAFGQAMQAAHDDGDSFGKAQAAAHVGTDDSTATASANVPGYHGASAPQTIYATNPSSLDATKASVAATNDGYRLTVDGNLSRPKVSSSEVKATMSRGNVVSDDPATYAEGITSGKAGKCVKLPPSSTSGGTYEATCDKGVDYQTVSKTCAVTTDVTTHSAPVTVYDYYVAPDGINRSPFARAATYAAGVADGTCQVASPPLIACTATTNVHWRFTDINCVTYTVQHLQCTTDYTVPGDRYTYIMPRTGKFWFATSIVNRTAATATPNASLCAPLLADNTCSSPVDACTDGNPSTRTFNGVAVTQSCWAWSRTYSCKGLTPANNCSSSTIPTGCTFAREECLDDPAPTDPAQCKVFQEVYTCPIKGPPAANQYVCGGDVYCIDGNCEPIVREQSTEFKDALVGMHTLSEASKSLNKLDYTLFKGTGQTCSKPVFGLGNCCGGHGFPLIGTCSGADKLLAGQIDKGLTHYVGTYCAHSFIVCTTKAQSYCVFGSKLTRILQEQGRPQIGKGWGPVKHPDCSGFTVDQFAQLDLSKMNFSEIYQDFISAAKLPDEAATLTSIQTKIKDYYKKGP